jgi:succinate dehydrogenase/fumarate reductase cytochrome b subunit
MAHATAVRRSKTRAASLDGGLLGIFVVLFFVFMAVALASTLLAQNWRTHLPGAEGAQSMLEGVKNAVWTVISQLS